MSGVPQKPVDHPELLAVLKAADYKCTLMYDDCEVTATEAAKCGASLKAACKSCRRRRLMRRSQGNTLAVKAARRAGR
jgi:hypothetical protein